MSEFDLSDDSELEAIALYDFEGDGDDELSFAKGDIITVTDKHTFRDWWVGSTVDARAGRFPSNRVSLLMEEPPSWPLPESEEHAKPMRWVTAVEAETQLDEAHAEAMRMLEERNAKLEEAKRKAQEEALSQLLNESSQSAVTGPSRPKMKVDWLESHSHEDMMDGLPTPDAQRSRVLEKPDEMFKDEQYPLVGPMLIAGGVILMAQTPLIAPFLPVPIPAIVRENAEQRSLATSQLIAAATKADLVQGGEALLSAGADPADGNALDADELELLDDAASDDWKGNTSTQHGPPKQIHVRTPPKLKIPPWNPPGRSFNASGASRLAREASERAAARQLAAMNRAGPLLIVGSSCAVTVWDKVLLEERRLCGTVRFIGPTEIGPTTVGVELDEADDGIGCDGSLDGITYFGCLPHCGVFVNPDQVHDRDSDRHLRFPRAPHPPPGSTPAWESHRRGLRSRVKEEEVVQPARTRTVPKPKAVVPGVAMAEKLFGKSDAVLVDWRGSQVLASSILGVGSHIVCFFGASWNSKSREIAEGLMGVFTEALDIDVAVEVIYVSFDQTIAEFERGFGVKAPYPWLALPFGDRDGAARLSRVLDYASCGIPLLVVLKPDLKQTMKLSKEWHGKTVRRALGLVKPGPRPLAELLGTRLREPGGSLCRTSKRVKNRLVGLFFAGIFDGKSRLVANRLAALYRTISRSEKKHLLEIVLISVDRNEEQYVNHVNQAPWPAVPWAQRDERATLARRFRVDMGHLPLLVLVNGDDGDDVVKESIKPDEILTEIQEWFKDESSEEEVAIPVIQKRRTSRGGRGRRLSQQVRSTDPLTMMIGPTLIGGGGQAVDARDGIGVAKVIGCYFGGLWNDECVKMMGILRDFLDGKRVRTRVAIVFVSQDRSEEEMKVHHEGIGDVYAVPFGSCGIVTERLGGLSGLPLIRLVSVDGGWMRDVGIGGLAKEM